MHIVQSFWFQDFNLILKIWSFCIYLKYHKKNVFNSRKNVLLFHRHFLVLRLFKVYNMQMLCVELVIMTLLTAWVLEYNTPTHTRIIIPLVISTHSCDVICVCVYVFYTLSHLDHCFHRHSLIQNENPLFSHAILVVNGAFDLEIVRDFLLRKHFC